MTWIGLPIDVVVIHRADHVPVQKCGVDRICFESGNKCGGFSITAPHGAMMLEQDLGVFLLAPTQRAANGIEPEQFRCLDRFRREMLVLECTSPLGDDVREKTLWFSRLMCHNDVDLRSS